MTTATDGQRADNLKNSLGALEYRVDGNDPETGAPVYTFVLDREGDTDEVIKGTLDFLEGRLNEIVRDQNKVEHDGMGTQPPQPDPAEAGDISAQDQAAAVDDTKLDEKLGDDHQDDGQR